MKKINLNQFFYNHEFDSKGPITVLINFSCNGNNLLIPLHKNPLDDSEISCSIKWVAPDIPKLIQLDLVMYSETIKQFFEIIRNFSKRDKRDNLYCLQSFENETTCLRFYEILVLIDNGYGKENIIPINDCFGIEKADKLKIRFSNFEVIPIKVETKNINDISYSKEVELQSIKLFLDFLKENDIEITKTILGISLTDEKGTYK